MINRLRQISIPILAKITVPYVFLALLIAVGGTYLVTNVVVDTVEERFTNQLIESGLLASEAVVRVEEDLLEELRLLSFVGGMSEAVSEGQADVITQLSLPVAYGSDVQAFAVLNARGRTLVNLRFHEDEQLYLPFGNSEAYGQLAFVQNVLSGEVDTEGNKFAGFVTGDEADYIFVAGPIEDEDGEIVGATLVGKSVAYLAETIREETLAQVTFYRLNGDSLMSTFEQPSSLAEDQAALVIERQDEGSLARELEDSSIAYRELLTTWEIRNQVDVGLMGIALPTSFITQTNQVTRSNILLLMGVAMVLVVLIGMVVAGRITRPIYAMRDAAKQVAGGDLGVVVPLTTRDELAALATSFNDMVRSLSESKRDQLETYDRTIEGWSRALDLRDHETEGHSQRVAAMTVELAWAMGVRGEELEHIRRGALLHDIGKIAIPDSVLLKEGPLSAEERKLINQHPNYARKFMEQVEFLKPALDIPYHHHERWDGNGYPKGLEGEEIPLAARLFAVVDVWDAITSDRPYRRAMKRSEALALIRAERGKHFDPEVLDVFVELLGEKDW